MIPARDLRHGLSLAYRVRMIDVAAIRTRFSAVAQFVDERVRRLVAARKAKAAGRGGIAATSAATAVAHNTIGRGLAELGTGRSVWVDRVRRPGAGRRPATEKQPGLPDALQEQVVSATRTRRCYG